MTREQLIIEAIRPYSNVANFSPIDVFATVERSVPDATGLEVAEAFKTLAEEFAQEAAYIHAELARRRAAAELG